MRGFKYITYEALGNGEIYERHAQTGEPLHHTQLRDARGHLDPVDMPGIYFCPSIDDLAPWVEECLQEGLCDDGFDILEVIPLGEVRERIYPDGRRALVTDTARVRVVPDRELPKWVFDLCEKYLG